MGVGGTRKRGWVLKIPNISTLLAINLPLSGLDKDGYIQLALAAISVIWCTYSSSLMFTTVLSMTEQRALVAYPAGLVYSAFAILAVYPLAATTSTAAGGAAEGSAAAVSGGGGLR